MSGLPDSSEKVADLLEEDKKLIEELVTNVCFHLISQNEINTSEGENSTETDNETCLEQRRASTIKHLVKKFFEDKEKTCKNNKICEFVKSFTNKIDVVQTETPKENVTEVDIPTVNKMNTEGNFTEYDVKTETSKENETETVIPTARKFNIQENFIKKEEVTEIEISKENATEVNISMLNEMSIEENLTKKEDIEGNEISKEFSSKNNIPTGGKINAIGPQIETSERKGKEIKPFHTVTEENESLQCKKCGKSICERETENKICNEDRTKIIGDANNNLILKIDSCDETEKEIKIICLTPQEEEEIISLILLAESNDCDQVPNKIEIKDDIVCHCLTPEMSERYKRRITVECEEYKKSESDLDGDLCKHSKEENLDGLEAMRNEYQHAQCSLPLMNDKSGPFYIRQSFVPVKYYLENLVSKKWKPTQVLYELCCQCNWPPPEFNIISSSSKQGVWYSVKVNDHNFVSCKKSRRKTEAKHHASATFLRFLGLKFTYKTLKKSDRLKFSSISPWSEKYAEFNSISLAKEEERNGGDKYSRSSRECKREFDSFCCYKRRRSSSSESRYSRSSSPDMRRDGRKFKQSRVEGSSRLRPRRSISPKHSHRRYNLRNYHEEKKRDRTIHERVNVTQVHERKPSHSSRYRDDRKSDRHKRHRSPYFLRLL